MIPLELSVPEIIKIKKKINPYILKTPILLNPNNISSKLNTEIALKLEFFQHGGTFKARGALNNVLNFLDSLFLKIL